ncbi:ParA family protein [Marinomonas sp. TI.3.20]|uniref:ParA family protein n=1 Tax=Marinomonas sp. TI.3.20 TaxID=3121296 RepID=UPI00311F4152
MIERDIEPSMVAKQIEGHASSLKNLRHSLTEMYRAIPKAELRNRKETAERVAINHSQTKNSLRDMLNISGTVLRNKLEEAQEAGVIGTHFEYGGGHRFFHDDVLKFMDWFGVPKFSDQFEPTVLAISTHKGGVAKSTVVATLASGLALDVRMRPRVLVVDLDPQGTVSSANIDTSQVDPNAIQLTALDLVLGDLERHHSSEKINRPDADYNIVMDDYLLDGITEDEAFVEIVKNTPMPTHLSNYDVLAGFPSDERLTDKYGVLSDEEQEQLLLRFSQKIIPILKEEYDIIIIDTPPQDSIYSWMAIDSADGLLVPTSASRYDISSTTNYLDSISKRLPYFPSGDGHFKFYRMILTNYNPANRIHEESRRHLLQVSKGLLMTKHMPHSPLFSLAAEANVTVHDFIQKDVLDRRLMSSKVFNDTMGQVNDWVSEIKDLIYTFCGKDTH